jgi:hypothetical protein
MFGPDEIGSMQQSRSWRGGGDTEREKGAIRSSPGSTAIPAASSATISPAAVPGTRAASAIPGAE